MHQHAPDAFLAHLVALARPGGHVAVQEYDADGLPCFPTFEAFERMIEAGLMAIKHVGTDPHAGRKLLDRFVRAELRNVRLETETPFVPFVDPRLEVMLDGFAVFGGVAELAGAMSAAEYEGLVDEVRAAHQDPLYANYLVRLPTLVAVMARGRATDWRPCLRRHVGCARSGPQRASDPDQRDEHRRPAQRLGQPGPEETIEPDQGYDYTCRRHNPGFAHL